MRRVLYSSGMLVLAAIDLGCGDAAPALITAQECTLFEGEPASSECPKGTEPILADIDDGRDCCVQKPVSIEQCEAVGATARSDPGDGSQKGCPDGEVALSRVAGFIEGGLCCR